MEKFHTLRGQTQLSIYTHTHKKKAVSDPTCGVEPYKYGGAQKAGQTPPQVGQVICVYTEGQKAGSDPASGVRPHNREHCVNAVHRNKNVNVNTLFQVTALNYMSLHLFFKFISINFCCSLILCMHLKVWNVFDGFLFKMYFATIFISDFVVYKTVRDFHALNLICHVICCITDIKVHLLYFHGLCMFCMYFCI